MVKLLNLSSDSWRSHSATDGLKNGDASSSSLAAKGFRSVRPNLQDKKSPSQVKHHSQYTDRHSRIYFCCCYLKFNYKCNFMMWCASVGFWVSEWGKKVIFNVIRNLDNIHILLLYSETSLLNFLISCFVLMIFFFLFCFSFLLFELTLVATF